MNDITGAPGEDDPWASYLYIIIMSNTLLFCRF